MYDSRIDRRKPGRDYLDPELENVVASTLIEGSRPRRYAYAAYQLGTACVIAGALLLLLSVSGSTAWTPSMVLEHGRSVLATVALSVVLSLVGAFTSTVSELRLERVPKS
jgi:hypothetical protein